MDRKRFFFTVLLCSLLALLAACQRYEPVAMLKEDPAARAEQAAEAGAEDTDADGAALSGDESGAAGADGDGTEPTEPAISLYSEPERTPVKVKGIYLGANAAGVSDFMDKIIKRIDETELNAVVIDVKDDYGRITYQMGGVPLVDELGAVEVKISDMAGLIKKLKSHGIYCIARIVALKDPYIAEQKPEWALHLADGSVFRDNKGDAWVDPYKQAYWDYLVDVSKAAGEIGFDEIQFDYIRFCTERGIDSVVYDEADTQGRDKIAIISELVDYLSKKLRAEGLFVSCDVFGTIIGSPIDAQSVGQDYTDMASKIDYICPMIYPSHYASGNFGLEHPDCQPYETILGALNQSRTELLKAQAAANRAAGSANAPAGSGTANGGGSYAGGSTAGTYTGSMAGAQEASGNGKGAVESGQAIVRPWLQSFTASYLGEGNYIPYDAETTRAQIQAVYDAGYDEWILWSASANYYYDGLLSPEAAEAEAESIAQSRAALPPETLPQAGNAGASAGTDGTSGGASASGGSSADGTAGGAAQNGTASGDALPGGELSESDLAILEQEGDIVITED